MTPKEIIAGWVSGSDGKDGPLTDHSLNCADTLIELLAQNGFGFKKKKYWTAELRNEASKLAASTYRGNQFAPKSE